MQFVDTLSDELLLDLSATLPGWRVECLDGRIVLTPPTGWNTGRRNARLIRLLDEFAEREGYELIDSSGGVRLPSGDALSADATLATIAHAAAVTGEGLGHLIPDVVVELVSPSDHGRQTSVEKCERWFAQGVGYVVLLDPFAKTQRTWGTPPAHFPDLSAVLTLTDRR